MRSIQKYLLITSFALGTIGAVNVQIRDGDTPGGQVDPSTSPSCTWWHDNDGSLPCASVPEYWAISLEDFLRWNPSLTALCGNFKLGYSYCVDASNEPPLSSTTGSSIPSTTRAVTATITTKPSTTTTKPPATTTTGNGISTPSPFLPGMVANCDVFDLVKSGETCASIASIRGVTLSDFVKFNPGVKSDCTGLWLDYYVCVSIIGHSLNTLTTTTKTTTSSNGIATPNPFLPGMVSNCDVFDLVRSGETCASIATTRGVSLSDFIKFNPSVKSDCTGLWLDYYTCVSIIGHELNTKTTTKATTTGNGIKTPLPIQTGMAKNCDTFDFIKDGETCASIAIARGVTLANFIKWNPGVGSGCTSLWLGTYACVGLI